MYTKHNIHKIFAYPFLNVIAITHIYNFCLYKVPMSQIKCWKKMSLNKKAICILVCICAHTLNE